ncbi:SRPBCC family protein [Tabrizicola soli]|nr:SRPBCC family protein [Tabrizicola soli]
MAEGMGAGGMAGRRALGWLILGGGIAAVAVLAWQSAQPPRGNRDSAPGRTARRTRWGEYAVTGHSVTIARPRAELYAFWRRFANLPQFMANLDSVAEEEGLTRWTIRAPMGRTVEVRTRIVTDQPGEVIAWRSVEGSEIDTSGKVMFADAPAGRGTVVTAIIAWDPPFGALGQMVARASGRAPGVQSRHELKRFKMLMETGEIATARRRPEE